MDKQITLNLGSYRNCRQPSTQYEPYSRLGEFLFIHVRSCSVMHGADAPHLIDLSPDALLTIVLNFGLRSVWFCLEAVEDYG